MSKDPQTLRSIIEVLPSIVKRELPFKSRNEILRAESVLSNVLLQLRSHMNVMTAVDRLPPEILLNIFERVTRHAGSGGGMYLNSKRRKRVPTRLLLTLTHVCKKWRDTAINAPALWTHIDDYKQPQLDTFLVRSRQAPLSIHILAKRSGPAAAGVLNAHGQRFKRLDITLQSGGDYILQLLTFKAPILQCLTITTEGRHSQLVIGTDHSPLLFHDLVCNLRALAIVGLYSWFPANQFPHLTHLYLAEITGFTGDLLHHITTLLSNTPILQFLHVGGLRPKASSTGVTHTVSLPALRSLVSTSGDLRSAFRLLSLLKLPEDALIRLDRMTCDTQFYHIHPDHVPVSRAYLNRLTRLEVATYDDELHLVAEGPNSGLWIQADSIGGDWLEWLTQLNVLLPMPYITALHHSAITEDLFLALLRQFPYLDELTLSLDSDRFEGCESSWVLAASLYDKLAGADGVIYCPGLEVLKIEAKTDVPGELAIDALFALAATRARLGQPLRRLEIQPGDMGVLDLFVEALAPIQEHVRVLRVGGFGGEGLCGFRMQSMWDVPGAERWWILPSDEKPLYILP
ncbi:hypothetical protein C8Q78DRAFT_1045849 [Trametes maxima]|nr:hypothetical protein C8Q78DRAFT_1045849 [Trametes maxima]